MEGQITRFGGERIDHTTGQRTVELNGMLRLEDGDLWWIMSDLNGSAFQVFDSSGQVLQESQTGLYGALPDFKEDWHNQGTRHRQGCRYGAGGRSRSRDKGLAKWHSRTRGDRGFRRGPNRKRAAEN